jgi:hypothetical protein
MYALILFVNYKQPAGALWLYFTFYGMHAKYISKWYNVMVEQNQGGSTMDNASGITEIMP